MKYIILSVCLLLSSCFTRYSGIGYEKYDVKNLETKGIAISGTYNKNIISYSSEYIDIVSGEVGNFFIIKNINRASIVVKPGKYILNTFYFNMNNNCKRSDDYTEYNVQCVALSAITQVDACTITCKDNYSIYNAYHGLTLQGPSYASFDVNAGEIIYIGDLNYDNFGINYLDNYEEAVAWFYKEYPQFKDKPVIKRIATLGPYAKNISLKK